MEKINDYIQNPNEKVENMIMFSSARIAESNEEIDKTVQLLNR